MAAPGRRGRATTSLAVAPEMARRILCAPKATTQRRRATHPNAPHSAARITEPRASAPLALRYHSGQRNGARRMLASGRCVSAWIASSRLYFESRSDWVIEPTLI
jgi:hypothetical protein